MQICVAFAVATATPLGDLIIEEALSVGDAYVQYKCFEHIRDYQTEGMSLLTVSHERTPIQTQWLHASDTHIAGNYDWWGLAAVFDVVNVNRPVFIGATWLPPEWECERG